MNEEDKCKRCGRCCYIHGIYPCPHLELLKGGKHHCTVYKERLTRRFRIDTEWHKCVDVNKRGFYEKGCAYSPDYKEKKGENR